MRRIIFLSLPFTLLACGDNDYERVCQLSIDCGFTSALTTRSSQDARECSESIEGAVLVVDAVGTTEPLALKTLKLFKYVKILVGLCRSSRRRSVWVSCPSTEPLTTKPAGIP